MKQILLFYLKDCPYCRFAKEALKELAEEDPAYAGVGVEWIEERERPELAARYDYYYVPTVFYGKTKLYEAHPSESYSDVKEHLRAALDEVLSA